MRQEAEANSNIVDLKKFNNMFAVLLVFLHAIKPLVSELTKIDNGKSI